MSSVRLALQPTAHHPAQPDVARTTPVAPASPDDDARSPIDARPSSTKFAALLTAFRATGGTARGDDLARLLEDRQCGDIVSLAKLLVAGEVFGFEWREALWIPMFQFELRDLSLKPGPKQVLAELAGSCDGWTIAAWFVRANCGLAERRPVDLLDSDLPAVLDAARAARFIAAG